jgi:hypothetical protein
MCCHPDQVVLVLVIMFTMFSLSLLYKLFFKMFISAKD